MKIQSVLRGLMLLSGLTLLSLVDGGEQQRFAGPDRPADAVRVAAPLIRPAGTFSPRGGGEGSLGRPSFVWIVSEDNSKHYLKMFDPAGTATPNIERLAQDGIRFNHAFSNAPVCSVARTTLATGVYAPRLGTQYHRRTKPVTLPSGWKMFSAFLKDAGYYTTNRSKTDYNAVAAPGTWDESSNTADWRKRSRADQPFFHMESHNVSHESSLHFSEQQMQSEPTETSPKDVTPAPYHPDTPLFRYTLARYHDRIRRVDDIVGQVVSRLAEDGLLEDTFVFYFGDHGGVLPRGKGYLYETGLHIPLVVRIPERWQHLVNFPRGSQVDGFVEFVDFGPTVLQLAGVSVPDYMDGRPFLGPSVTLDEVNSRQETLGYADRFDEKYEMVRTLRIGQWKYHRNYEGFYPDSLQNNYRYQMLAYQQWRSMYQLNQLNDVQKAFFEPRPAEALYDLNADPDEIRNLAADPAHRQTLLMLRERLRIRLKSMPDLSFLPEPFLVAEGLDDPIAFGRKHGNRISGLIETADLALQSFDESRASLMAALSSDDPFQRQRALMVCTSFGEDAVSLADRAESLLTDKDHLTRLRAVEFLAGIRKVDPIPVLMEILRTSDDPLVSAIALNSAVYLRDVLKYPLVISRSDVQASGDSINRRLQYFSPQEAVPDEAAGRKQRSKQQRRQK